MNTATLNQKSADRYEAQDGHTMQRERGLTPNGNPLGGKWVLRSPDGSFMDFDQYRIDLAQRFGFAINP